MTICQIRVDLNVMADMIKKRRKAHQLSLRDASKQVGVSKATLSRLENKTFPTFTSMIKLCSWLDVTPDQLLGIRPSQHGVIRVHAPVAVPPPQSSRSSRSSRSLDSNNNANANPDLNSDFDTHDKT